MSKVEMFELGIKYYNMFPRNAVIKIPMDCRDSQNAFEVMKELNKLFVIWVDSLIVNSNSV
jgi:hypothetical protein